MGLVVAWIFKWLWILGSGVVTVLLVSLAWRFLIRTDHIQNRSLTYRRRLRWVSLASAWVLGGWLGWRHYAPTYYIEAIGSSMVPEPSS